MAWAKGDWAGAQAGIKSLAEGLNGRCGMVATQCVAPGVGRMGDATTWGRMMRRIHNREGSKQGGENRHRAGGKNPRTEWFT